MKNYLFIKVLVSFSIVSFFSGCASGPNLKNYPRTEIDRPYTLPGGVAAWHIVSEYEHYSDNYSDTTIYPIPIPLIWETALSDDWMLTWAPIPLAISHQFWNDQTSRLGASVTLGFSDSSNTGFRLAPIFSVSYRLKLSPTLALVVSPFYSPDIPFQDGQPFRWSTGLTVGPLFQLDEFFSVEPNVSFSVHRGTIATADTSDPISSFGVGASAVWSISRRWDFRPSYSYSGIGSSDGYRSHLASADFVYFW